MSDSEVDAYAVATTMVRNTGNITNIITNLIVLDARSKDEALGKHARMCIAINTDHTVFHQLSTVLDHALIEDVVNA